MMGHNGDDNQTIGSGIPRTILSLMFIMCGISFCMVSLIVSIDTACNITIDRWLPFYPGAEEVSVQYDFFRPRGMGNTFIIFHTPDEPAIVRGWYGDYSRKLIRENANNPATKGMARTSYRITENPDGTGTLIYQVSECADN